jgi:hypothetical protein
MLGANKDKPLYFRPRIDHHLAGENPLAPFLENGGSEGHRW